MAIEDTTNYSLTGAQIKDIASRINSKAESSAVLPASTKYGASLTLSIDNTTYVITATLKDQDGNTLGTAQTIDLPLESVVVSGAYDNTTKKVVLTLKDGSTVEFSVADLVAGLQTEITSTNLLGADLVDDSTSTHKFATAAQLTKLNGLPAITSIGTGLTLTNGTLSANVSTIPVATTSTLGGVIVGSGLTITAGGVLSATTQASSITTTEWNNLWS